MNKQLLLAAAVFALTFPVAAQEAEPQGAPSPNQIVEAAADSEWISIPAEDLLVMTLAPDRDGNPREVVIQLMPAPFSQGWTRNIRTLARAEWYDGITVNRVQDNYVVQWGDPNYDNPEAEGETKPLPEGLKVMEESEYLIRFSDGLFQTLWTLNGRQQIPYRYFVPPPEISFPVSETFEQPEPKFSDPYSFDSSFFGGFPIGVQTALSDHARPEEIMASPEKVWPVHCYGMVGVGRSYSPDTGSGAELYTVIGHAPRHLDRNIALVGRIISGMEYLSSLPRGTGALGFYSEEEFDKRTPILTVRVASDLPEMEQPLFEYLSTESNSFARYADARANRRDPFFIHPAGGADICNIPVPTRPTPNG